MVRYFQAGIIFLAGCSPHFASSGKAGHFTGTIEYKYTYESNSLNTDSLAKHKPYKSEIRFDTLNYQSRFFGKDTITYYYSGLSAKCITQINSQEQFECEDYRIATDTVISCKVYETKEKVLGHTCRIIKCQGKYFYNIFYVATELKMSPGTYKNHVAYNWKFYAEKTGGGIVLKSEHRFKNYTMKGIAVNIQSGGSEFKALSIGDDRFINTCK
jgi:hypothetical protein